MPNSVRPLNPMMPDGDTSMFNNVDVNGNPTGNIINQLVNFGWEYVIHCHILSHEEMDMMRPESVAVPPRKATDLTYTKVTTGPSRNRRVTVHWTDNSINETSFVLQRSTDGTTWSDVATSASPLDSPNTHGPRSLTDQDSRVDRAYTYRVVALNTVGYGGEFPSLTVKSVSAELAVPATTNGGGGGGRPRIAVSPQALAVDVNGLAAPAVQWQVNAGAPAARVAGSATQRAAGVVAPSGDGFTDIPGATDAILPLTDGLRGKLVRVVVSYTDENDEPQTVTSDPAMVPMAKAGAVHVRKVRAGARGGRSTAKVAWSPTTTGGMPILGYKVVAQRIRHGEVVGSRHGSRCGPTCTTR